MKQLRLLLLLGIGICLHMPLQALNPTQDDIILREFMWQRFVSLPRNERPQIGLALSAGGVRGFAHVGVLEVFDNARVPVDKIAGTSMGSVIGGLYAAGLSTDELWELGNHITLDTITPDLNAGGLFRLLFQKRLPTSANSIAVRASMNLPGIFEPVPYRHRLLVDGAVVDYLPVDSVQQMGADYIIASVTPLDFSSKTPSSILGYVNRVNDVRAAAMIEDSSRKANFVLINRVLDTGTLELNKLHQAGEVGVKEAYSKLGALQEDILLFALPYVFKK